MSYPYTCATCRLQSALQRFSLTTYRQRQWLSQAIRLRQIHAEEPSSSGRLNTSKFSNTLETQRGKFQNQATRGRYSGRPLAPQELLEQLGSFPDEPHGNDQHRLTKQRRSQSRDNNELHTERSLSQLSAKAKPKGKENLPPRLYGVYKRFLDAAEMRPGHQPDFQEVLNTLHEIAGIPDGTLLTARTGFQRQCYFLMRTLCETWTSTLSNDDGSAQVKPTPVEVLIAMSPCNGGYHRIYALALWQLASASVRLRTKDTTTLNSAFLRCMRELMLSWNVTMRAALSPSKIVGLEAGAPLDWSFLPDNATLAQDLQHQRQTAGGLPFSFGGVLNMFVPEYTVSPEDAARLKSKGVEIFDYHSAAWITLDLLRETRSGADGSLAVEEFRPWLNFIEILFQSVGHAWVPPAIAQKLKSSDFSGYYRGLITRMTSLAASPGNGAAESSRKEVPEAYSQPSQKTDDTSPVSESAEGIPSTQSNVPKISTSNTTPASRFATIASNRLGRALERRDTFAANEVYKDLQSFASRNPNTVLPIELYENLLYTILSLHATKEIVPIWNAMVAAGHRPSTKTYTIMMRGSQEIRDRAATMEKFWGRMRQAGLQPDHHAWTTRIFGMLRSHLSVDAATRALEEMGQEWLAAARRAWSKEIDLKGKKREQASAAVQTPDLLAKYSGDVNGVPRPDITIMNAAISGLAAKAEADDLIPRVLSWGRSYGIEPDLKTYNVLINICMRQGLPGEALKMLQRMEEKGIEADSTTWTILLSAVFRVYQQESLSTQEVQKRILDFVGYIDDASTTGLDAKGYALIVHHLLTTYNNPAGAQKLLEHMASKGRRPNTHLFSILMTSYFQQSPPNFGAVESLWNTIQSEDKGYGAKLDALFYDRMVEAYAQNHKMVGTKPMLSFFDRMQAQGKRPSWRALEYVARALAEEGNWTKLTQIAEHASKERASLHDQDGYGKREFWRFLESIGIYQQ